MMCDLSSSQSEHRFKHFCRAKLIFLGVAADLCCCFYIKRNFLRDCNRDSPCSERTQGWGCVMDCTLGERLLLGGLVRMPTSPGC